VARADARALIDDGAWRAAHHLLSEQAREGTLDGVGIERLATVTQLMGDELGSFDLWERAHRAHLADGDVPGAVRSAFWLCFGLMNRGERGRANGWLQRGQRLLDSDTPGCVEDGYLQHQVGLRCALGGDPARALAAFRAAVEIAARFDDRQLAALACVGEGRCLIYLGAVSEGLARLDEAMVAASSGELSPVAVGDTYCTVIEACHEVFDIDRTREWTAALSRWCDSRPDLVLHRRACLVHRAELMLLGGDWEEAGTELGTACDQPEHPGALILAQAWYLRGELARLCGAGAEAEVAYGRSDRLGRPPQPGRSLLRLAQARPGASFRMIRRALSEAEPRLARAPLLAPAVEIALAADEAGPAQDWAAELEATAQEVGSAYLRASADAVRGALLIREGDARAALRRLRRAWTGWQALRVPYEDARVRVLMALGCRTLGDDDSSTMELEAARATFHRLGAVDDLAGLAGFDEPPPVPSPHGLSGRELEVLHLVAEGLANRAIARELAVADKTVASHVSHIFTKLGVANRAAATAFAYRHGIVGTSRPHDR
jgi:DNA-binding NarL/FixJ family response regulator